MTRFVRCTIAALMLTAVALAAAGCGSSGSAPEYKGVVRTPPLRAGSLTLPDVAPAAKGADAPLRAPKGTLRLLYFGYTYCPDVCPTTLSDLKAALAMLTPEQRRRLGFAMVTVDPQRDTPRQFNRYLSHFFPRWAAFRTTDPARLRQAERVFGAQSKKGPVDKDGNYDMSHTAWVYAVDDHGASRLQWAFGTEPADIAHDLRLLLADQSRAT